MIRSLKNTLRPFVPWPLLRLVRKTKENRAIQQMIKTRVTPGTTMLADFPRCGIGWIRFIVATVHHFQKTGEFRKLSHSEMYSYSPTLSGTEAIYRPYHYKGHRCVLKTHYAYRPEFKRGLVVYRDPFDAIVSMYANDLMDGGGNAYLDYKLANHSEEEAYLIFRTREYVVFQRSWWQAIQDHHGHFISLQYERMLADPVPTIVKILDFLETDYRGLPAGALDTLGKMYGRTDVTRPSGGTNSLEEALKIKFGIFERAKPMMNAENLKRLDARLSDDVAATVRDMDKVAVNL